MKRLKIDTLEDQIVQDKNFLFTVISYFVILAVFVNLNTLKFPLIGSAALVIYFAINSVFLGNAFFGNENGFLRLILGVLLLIILLSLLGWLAIMVYNLDIVLFSLVLVVAATISSLINRRMKY